VKDALTAGIHHGAGSSCSSLTPGGAATLAQSCTSGTESTIDSHHDKNSAQSGFKLRAVAGRIFSKVSHNTTSAVIEELRLVGAFGSGGVGSNSDATDFSKSGSVGITPHGRTRAQMGFGNS
jgi:hypothetical protein